MDDNAREILVGYDGSPDSDLAVQWAARTALVEGRPVRVEIIDDSGAYPPGIPLWPEEYWLELETQAAGLLSVAGVDDGTVRRTRGRLVPTMTALAHDASLLVLGSHGHTRAGEFFLGSVSQHLARHAPCPVVVVRPAESLDADRIAVGLDGSRASEEALEFACRRAEATGEKVAAVRAAKVAMQIDRKGRMPADMGVVLADAEKQLGESVADAAAAHPGVEIEQEVIALSPAEALVGTSRHASLVVVGSRGRNAFTGMLLGSVSQEVLHRAHCPVAVVR